MATPAAHPPKALDDRELARLAVAGDGNAFAELYDRHEQRVYGFCMRMLGTPHDAADATQETFVRLLGRLPALEGRDLNFVAYALAAARNACYDMIEGRRKAEPMAEQPEPLGPQEGDLERDPERAALLAAAREDVQAANAALPPRQREVLALREVELLSYDEIGELMGLNRNAVAQLVSRARIKLRDLMRDSALASVSASSADCARALPLLASIQDDQRGSAAELEWVHAHIAGCDTCRLSRAAMEEAGVSYRALAAPIVPLVWLRHAAIAHAAEFVGADWSGVAGPGSGAGGPGSGSSELPSGAYGSVGRAAEEQSGRPGWPVARSGAGVWARTRRGRLTWTLVAGSLLALCIVLVAMVGGTRDGHVSLHPAVTGAAAAHPIATAIRRPHHRTTSAPVAKHGGPGFHNPAHTGTALTVSTAGAPHHSTDRVRSGGHRRHRTPARHRPAPAKPTPPPPATTPAATTPTTTTPVAPPSPPATTPTTTSPPPTTTPTTTTPPTRTMPEPAPPGLIP